MKKYNSKIGYGIVVFIAIVLGGTSTMLIVNQVWLGLIINIAVAGFIAYMFISTFYIIDGNDLIIKCGFMANTTIKIDKIKKIMETNNPLSSPANSLDRIAIYYNNSGFIMISPKDKINFIDQLTAINPKIEIILNDKNK